MLQYNVSISASLYASYYFELRTLCECMGGYGDVSSRVTIPVMMVSEDDGSDLHATIRQPSGGTSPPAAIEVSITDPSRRPTTLRAGRPQDGSLEAYGVARYRLRVDGVMAHIP